MSVSESWIVIYTTYNEMEAHIVAGRLQSEGIRALVHQEPAGSAFGIQVGPLGEVKVLVLETDYDRAVDILDPEENDALPDDVNRIVYDDDEDARE